jgi:hypothetical protein
MKTKVTDKELNLFAKEHSWEHGMNNSQRHHNM